MAVVTNVVGEGHAILMQDDAVARRVYNKTPQGKQHGGGAQRNNQSWRARIRENRCSSALAESPKQQCQGAA